MLYISDPNGPYVEWEDPQVGADYVLGGDASEGRSTRSDHTCFTCFRREPFRLVQVAEWYGRIRQGEAGDKLYAMGRRWNWAMLNPERNVSAALEYAVLRHGYPTTRLFLEPNTEFGHKEAGDIYFTTTTRQAKIRMRDIMRLYLAGRTKLIVLRSIPTIDELGALDKDANDVPITGGKDRAMATFMAMYADAFSPEKFRSAIARQKDQELPPPGRTSALTRYLQERAPSDSLGVPEFEKR